MTRHYHRFLCWLLGHRFDYEGMGWGPYALLTCKRCKHSEKRWIA